MSKTVQPDGSGFTAGEQTTANVGDLKPHPRNEDLYDDRENDELVSRMKRVGFRESQRILITEDGTILSGHRRWGSAKKAGIEAVPVEVVGIDPNSKEAELELLTANAHREKTDIEKYREAKAWKELVHEQSEDLEIVQPNKDSDPRKVATEKAGMPESRFAKMARVERAAEDGGDVAQTQWQDLQSGDQSVHGAYKAVVDAEKDDDPGPDEDEPTESTDTDGEGDEKDVVADTGDGFRAAVESMDEDSDDADSSEQEQESSDGETTDDAQDTEEEESAEGDPERSGNVGAKKPDGWQPQGARVKELQEENEHLKERIDYLQEGSVRQAARVQEYRKKALDAADMTATVRKAKGEVEEAKKALTPAGNEDLDDRDIQQAHTKLDEAKAYLKGVVGDE